MATFTIFSDGNIVRGGLSANDALIAYMDRDYGERVIVRDEHGRAYSYTELSDLAYVETGQADRDARRAAEADAAIARHEADREAAMLDAAREAVEASDMLATIERVETFELVAENGHTLVIVGFTFEGSDARAVRAEALVDLSYDPRVVTVSQSETAIDGALYLQYGIVHTRPLRRRATA